MLLPGELRVRFPGISRDPSSTSPLQPPRRSAGWDPCSPPLSSACPSPWYSGGEEASQALEGRPRELPLQSTRGRVHDRDWGYLPGAVLTHRVPSWWGPPPPRGSGNSGEAEPGRGCDGRASGRGRQPSPGAEPGRSARGASGTAKLSPPPEVRGAEETEREAERCLRCPYPGLPGSKAAPRRASAARSAPPPPHAPLTCARPARTHLAVELADRHDPARRAAPGLPRPRTASSLPQRLSVHGGPAWRHLPGLAESCCVSPSLSPDLPGRLPGGATFTLAAAASLRPGRSCERAGQEAARRRSPRRCGGRCRRGAGPGRGHLRASERATRLCRRQRLCARRARLHAPSRAPAPAAAAGSTGPGAGRPRSWRRPPPAGRRRSRDRCAPAAAPAAPSSRSSPAVPGEAGRGCSADKKKKKKEESNQKQGKRNKRRDVYDQKAPCILL